MRRLRSSKIKKRISVPNTVGMVRAEALSLLNSLGLSVRENNAGTSNESLGGKIIDQSIAENSVVAVGTEIEYTYGSFSFTPFGFTPFSFTAPPDPEPDPRGDNPPGDPDPPVYAFDAPLIDLFPFSFTPIVVPPYDFTTYNFAPYSFSTPLTKSVGATSLIKSKNPEGLILAYNLNVGDVLYSASIEGIDVSNDQILNYLHNWSAENALINTEAETTIVAMAARIADGAIVINENKYSKAHWILIKNNEEIRFKNVTDVLQTDLVFSPSINDWIPVDQYTETNSKEMVVSINVEPYDVFFTDNALVHDSYNASLDTNAINSSQEDFSDKIIKMYTEWQNLIKE